MANYCNTSYVVEGNKEELDCLYQTMERLQNMEQPLVENGFGTTWLGCLIAELGGNIEDYYCKGDWVGWNVKVIQSDLLQNQPGNLPSTRLVCFRRSSQPWYSISLLKNQGARSF